MRSARRIGAALVLVLVVAACGDDDTPGLGAPATTRVLPAPTTAPPPDPATDDEPDEPAADPAPVEPAAVTEIDSAAVTLTLVAELDRPIALATRAGSPHLFVAERGGRVRTVELTAGPDGTVVAGIGPTVVDLSDRVRTDGERGLLGIDFSPDGARLYVSYSDRDGNTVLEAMAMAGAAADPATAERLLFVEQPYPNHNGGQVSIGPDGMLYLGLGDGGGGGDPLATGQDPTDLLGSILRVDPRPDGAGAAYRIPADNPFADGAGGAPEVWIWGVRNPWRFSWDRATGDLWIADVGQNAVEEVTLLPAAGDGTPPGRAANLGWSVFEGDRPYSGAPDPGGTTFPVLTYGHDAGCSITGGFVSRGDALAALRGAYVFSDYCAADLRAALVRDGELVASRSLGVAVPGGQVVSFGEGPDGELYVLSLAGSVHRIDPAP